jgi:hypothetical protein
LSARSSGVELTRVYADTHGRRIFPADNAERVRCGPEED